MSEDAKAQLMPYLEIDEQEVKATHTTFVGPLDEEELFYARSRGLTEKEAKLRSISERQAWAYALRALRDMQRQGIDTQEIFPDFHSVKDELDSYLGSYSRRYALDILRRDPSFYEELKELFDRGRNIA